MSKANDQRIYDVLQVGYGPVSQVLAITLARQGHSVCVFEMWAKRFPLPRAVCIDHEMYRMLSAIGLRDQLPTVSHPAPQYRWFNAEWKELLHIDWSAESISGGSEVNFIHQPTLESMFDTTVASYQEVELNLGWEVTEIRQTADYAEVIAREVSTGRTRNVRAKYLIGVDGANSLARKAIGSAQEDLGFEADWLVIDILPNEGAQLNIPPAAQYCNPARPTTIVPAGIRDGRYYRRWEFMRLPHESRESLETEEMAWKLLEPWVKPGQAVIQRAKVYNFRSLIAQNWRDRRILLAGDAAHVMPPFMGQGMCAGLRDDWNLAWKLDLVLRGQASDSLLDTYQTERRPHAKDVIELSMYLGKVICIPDPIKAAERDRAFFDGTVAPPPPFPSLVDGILHGAANGGIKPAAGLLSPHGTIRYQNRTGRFDDLIGLGFVLMLRGTNEEQAVSAANRSFLEKLNAKVVHLASDDTAPVSLIDLDGKFTSFMDQHGLRAMLIRPDFYLYGGVGDKAQISDLVDSLAADLKRHEVLATADIE